MSTNKCFVVLCAANGPTGREGEVSATATTKAEGREHFVLGRGF